MAGTSSIAFAVSERTSGSAISARLSKKSFTSSQAKSVKLTCKFSKKSGSFSYSLTLKKGSKWKTVKSVKKRKYSKGSYKTTVKKVFGGKSVKLGSYRLKLSTAGRSKQLSFKVIKPAKPAASPDDGSGGNAPVNTSLPTISGTARQGQTLTASNGGWQNAASYAYQWRRCDSAGNNCSNVSGAVSNSFLLQVADVGRTIRIAVTGSNASGSETAVSNQTAVVAGPPPVNTALPTISGVAKQNVTLTASKGTWSNSPTSFEYQWLSCDGSSNDCYAIDGANSSTYVPDAYDAGWTLRVVVTASNAYGSVAATSNYTAIVIGLPPVNTALPTITGVTTEGHTLTGSDGSWGNLPYYFEYRWQRWSGASWLDIPGADSYYYGLHAPDSNTSIRLVVTAYNDYGQNDVASSPSPTISPLAKVGGWLWQNPLPNGNSFSGVDFFDVTHGWAVGENGALIATSDAGTTWSEQNSGTSYDLYSVSFGDPDNGWVVGWGGTILHTSNGGSDWGEQGSGTLDDLFDVSFTSSTRGWAVGSEGTILYTNDGGVTWSKQSSGAFEDLYSINCSGANNCWAVGTYGAILHTSNGTTWNYQDSGTEEDLYGISCADANHCLAVGTNTTSVYTSNGGTNWSMNRMGYGDSFFDVSLVYDATDSLYRGWVVRSDGAIFTTANGGASVNWQRPQSDGSLLGIDFIDPAHGWAVGTSGTIVTLNGTTWSRQGAGTHQNILDVDFFSTEKGCATSASSWSEHSVTKCTSDGGTTWNETSWTYDDSRGVSFADADNVWVVGAYLDSRRFIAHSSDGGVNWVEQSSQSSVLYDVDFVDLNHGWTVGSGGAVLAWSGTDWTQQRSGSTTLHATSFVYDSDTSTYRGWAVGENGTVTRTSDGGSTWSTQTLGSSYLTGVDFVDASHGWAVGATYGSGGRNYGPGVIFATTDGGATWNSQDAGGVGRLSGVSFVYDSSIDDYRGWAVGVDGTALTTSDGGAHWSAQNPGTYSDLNGVAFVDASHGWAVGGGGTILATATGGVPVP